MNVFHLLVELSPVVLAKMLLNRTQNSSECLAVKLQQSALLRLDPDTEWSLLIVDQCQLSEMCTWLKLSHANEAISAFDLVEFETINSALVNDIEFITFFSFLDDELLAGKVDYLESVDKLQLLEFVKFICIK